MKICARDIRLAHKPNPAQAHPPLRTKIAPWCAVTRRPTISDIVYVGQLRRQLSITYTYTSTQGRRNREEQKKPHAFSLHISLRPLTYTYMYTYVCTFWVPPYVYFGFCVTWTSAAPAHVDQEETPLRIRIRIRWQERGREGFVTALRALSKPCSAFPLRGNASP